jgi:RHS repeat-associated protein
MKALVIFLILLIVSMPISYAKVFDVPEVKDDPEPLREDSNVKKFIYAGSKVIDSIEDSEIKYYHQGRMSNRLITDINGNKENEFKSLPFGQKIENSGVDYPFTGKEEDESSLYYFGARYYDDNLGRFSGVDPIAGEHSYAYVLNNPMNLVDPTGMESWTMDSSNVFGAPGWVSESVPDEVFTSMQWEVGQQDSSVNFYKFGSGWGMTNSAGSWADYGNGELIKYSAMGIGVLSDMDLRRMAGEVGYLEELIHQAPAIAVSLVFSYFMLAGRGGPSYGKVPAESVRYNNRAAYNTVLNGERPVALLEEGGITYAPKAEVREMVLKLATERGAIGGYTKGWWFAVNEQGVRNGIPNQFFVVYGKGARAETLASELVELYSGDIPIRQGFLPGFNHARVGQILNYPDDEIASFLSSNNIIGQ